MQRKYTALGDLIQVTQLSYPPPPSLPSSFVFLSFSEEPSSFYEFLSHVWYVLGNLKSMK